jgi:hypothetical protein
MASAAHVYGKRILGAEAFTASDGKRWQGHPAGIKDLGNWAFCEGINRFVFHRYPHCDAEVKALATEMWGTDAAPAELTGRSFGKGRIFWGGAIRPKEAPAPEPVNQFGSARWIWRKEAGSAETVELERQPGGNLAARVWQPGKYEIYAVGGRAARFEVAAPPPPLAIAGPWDLAFPPNWGAPPRVTLDRLISWSEHPDAGVKYFSGTATYRKAFNVPPDLLTPDRRQHLDLGQVAVMAEVKLNGKDLGILWKPPYRVEVTSALRTGDNVREVKVVNLWINRLIGDEQLPEDSNRNPEGTLKSWPQWVLDGKPSPAGRYTFTSWRLWKKTDALVASGLLGPVAIHAVQEIALNEP